MSEGRRRAREGRGLGHAMLLALLLSAVSTSRVAAHPASLECGNDATSRLRLGQNFQVMQGDVTQGGNADGVAVTMAADMKSALITAPPNVFFAAKLFGGGNITLGKGSSTLVMTAGTNTTQCTSQVYTPVFPKPYGGNFTIGLVGTGPSPEIVVGYSSTGPPGIKVVSSKDKPGPAPPPGPPSALLPFGIVDTHVHLATTSNGINYTWTRPTKPSECPCRPPCFCNMSLPEYSNASVAAPASYIVFCEVSANASQWLQEAQWVQKLAVSPEYTAATTMHTTAEAGSSVYGMAPPPLPQIGAIIAQPPPGFGSLPVANLTAHLDKLQELELARGLRVYLDKGDPVHMKAGLQELGRRGLVVDFFVPDITNSSAVNLVRQSAGTVFNVEHLGCGCDTKGLYSNKTQFAAWQKAVKALAKLPNIGCFQLGGTMASFLLKSAVNPAMILPFIQTAVSAFGYDRLCFEANWFFSNFQAGSPGAMDGFGTWVEILVPMLENIGASPADLERVFRLNAMSVYGIANSTAPQHLE